MTAADQSPLTGIRAVWFDVGEVLIDETREYGTWADWLGVPRHTFSAVFGAVIASGSDYRDVFQHFRPGFDLEAERQARLEAGLGEYLNASDLYPDVRPALQQLRQRGIFVGVAGNQTLRAGRFLSELNLPIDLLATSDDWAVAKPDIGFFERMILVSGHPAAATLYVGDRLDNDVAPAVRAGLKVAWLRRGPWGYVLDARLAAELGSADQPDLVINSLSQLPLLIV